MTTFGYELEFAEEPVGLIAALTERGFAHQSEGRLHSYHCDCGYCSDLWSTAFRAQRDSSCGGEVISGIFTDENWEHATAAMFALQEAALDVDAGIDVRCGMHVHLGTLDNDLATAQNLSMAWLGLEPLLWEHVAGSVWAHRRSNFNALVSTAVLDQVQNATFWRDEGTYPVAERDLDAISDRLKTYYKASFLRALDMMRWDRHCDLARATHGGIYEVRIFNATRVAWRIEMACRLSVALVQPEIAEQFAQITEEWLFGGTATLANRMMTLRHGYRRTGRQYTGQEDRPLVPNLPISMETFMRIMSEHDERLGELLVKQTGYAAARKATGRIRSVITNAVDTAALNHDAVLAALGVSNA